MERTPLLLLDNNAMGSVMNLGDYKCTNVTFEEATALIDTYEEENLLRCFTNAEIDSIIFDYLGITRKEIAYKKIRDMRVGQDALVFKLYTTPSETQPVIVTDKGNEAKKIQNVYVYCQLVSRIS